MSSASPSSPSIPSACCLSDLPGNRQRRLLARIFTAAATTPPILIVLFFTLVFQLQPVAESCSPSWLREERSADAAAAALHNTTAASTADAAAAALRGAGGTSSNFLDDDDYPEFAGWPKEKACGWPENISYCAQGNCSLELSLARGAYVPFCRCWRGFTGHHCEFPADPNVYAAQLLLARDGRVAAPLAALAAFSALALATLGVALYLYRKLLEEATAEQRGGVMGSVVECTGSGGGTRLSLFTPSASSKLGRRGALFRAPGAAPEQPPPPVAVEVVALSALAERRRLRDEPVEASQVV